MTITAAADGSSLGNPGPAGWAWYVDDDCWASGGWPVGTNNMGELMAVLDLLRQTAHVDEPLHVLCDSQYAINVVSKWSKGWKKKGWKKADGKPVLNVDLVKDLDAAMQGRTVTFEWVRGHNGHEMNEAADLRARAAATAYQRHQDPDPGPGFPGAGTGGGPLPSFADLGGGPEVEGTDPADDYLQPELFSDEPAGPELDLPDVDQVVELERWLHGADPSEDTSEWASLLHSGWFRVRADGTLHHRADVLSGVLSPDRCDLDVIEARRVRPDEVLLLTRGVAGDGTPQTTLRTTLWVREGAQWQQRFEQVTAEA
ncbi:RNase H family protein [Raineyella antarctica]|uniref:RNase H family protein n=1 Tax=Raineyella antarctica TaxID=1577474 RepID=UPI000B8851C3|nr:RNase H family protein [Raineyella antarctica]